MPTRRQRQVSELIKRELSLLLLLEVRDPRLSDVTITDVDVTKDLLLAQVHFTVMGEEEAKAEAIAALDHAKSYLRTALANRIELRFVPELVFKLDRSGEYGRRIDQLLDQLREDGLLGDESEPS